MSHSVRRLTLCFVVVLALMLLPALRVAGIDFSKGDEWNYQVTDSYQQTNMTGTMRTYYSGTSSISVNGTNYNVYVIDSNTSLTIEGNDQQGAISGTMTINDRTCYDIDNLDIVLFEYNQSVHAVISSSNGSESIDTWEHNVTTYTPPSGFGTWPSTVSAGDTWTISYPERSQITRYENGTTTSAVFVENNTVTYRYDGVFDVVVPAGEFECRVFEEIFPDGTQTYWISDKAGANVQITGKASDGEVATWKLVSYTYSAGVSKDPMIFYAAGILIAAVSALLVLMIIVIQKRKRRPPAADSLLQPLQDIQYSPPSSYPGDFGR